MDNTLDFTIFQVAVPDYNVLLFLDEHVMVSQTAQTQRTNAGVHIAQWPVEQVYAVRWIRAAYPRIFAVMELLTAPMVATNLAAVSYYRARCNVTTDV